MLLYMHNQKQRCGYRIELSVIQWHSYVKFAQVFFFTWCTFIIFCLNIVTVLN